VKDGSGYPPLQRRSGCGAGPATAGSPDRRLSATRALQGGVGTDSLACWVTELSWQAEI